MQVLLIAQTDVSAQVEAEARVAELTEASVSLLELIFPRHVIEHMTRGQPQVRVRQMCGFYSCRGSTGVLCKCVCVFATCVCVLRALGAARCALCI